MSSILDIAISGLNAASTRVANAASNIVNASSTAKLPSDSGSYTGYVPEDTVSLSNNVGGNNLGVTTQTVPRNPSYTSTFDPNTSNANGEGLVATPNVDIATELVATVSAKANYGANAAVIKVDQNLDKTLLDITT